MESTFLRLAAIAIAASVLSGCFSIEKMQRRQKLAKARALFEEHCKTAGERIETRFEGVEGVLLLKIRPEGINYGNQYSLTDPYGLDFRGDAYIRSFIDGFHPPIDAPNGRFKWVEVIDLAGVRFRYTGQDELVDTTRTDRDGKKVKSTTWEFLLQRKLAKGAEPRFAVTYEDLSTRQDRDHWIAGSSLQVIDRVESRVIAERIGFMVDWGQGANSGGRSPWLHAANTACPMFPGQYKSLNQRGQTIRFVTKVLQPQRGE